MSKTKDSIKVVQDAFLDNINTICRKFGLNYIMAQLYTVLYFRGKPMSLDDMVEQLEISKASASVNIRALENYGAVRRIWVKGSRKDYYEAEPDIAKVIVGRIRSMAGRRLSEVNNMITSSSGILESLDLEAEDESVKMFKERLEKLRALYAQAQSMFDLLNATMLNKVASAKEETEKAELIYAEKDTIKL